MKSNLADKFYIDEAIKKVDCNNDFIDSFVYAMQGAHYQAVERDLRQILKKKAWPKIWGEPTKFSLWWRFIKVEKIEISPYRTKIMVRQFGKVIAEKESLLSTQTVI